MNTKQAPDRKDIAVANLQFDPQNPRFPAEVASGPEADLIERFIRDERLAEIINSIGDHGYFDGEPLLVTPAPGTPDKYHVIEGNRRLAALKLLSQQLSVPEGRTSIEDSCNQAINRPETAPCLVFNNQDEILRYLGFRHITGIKNWSSLQKARYIKKLRDRFYSNLEPREQWTALSREIGSRADYVAQMLSALNLYERAESNNFFGLPIESTQNIDFSLLSTAISYSAIVSFLGLESRQDSIGENIDENALKNLINWLFVAQNGQKTVLGESRNLKRLAAVVESPAASLELVKSGDLDSAFTLSKGPAQALTLTLNAIEKKLQEAWGWIPTIEEPEPEVEVIAEAIRKRAHELSQAIKAKRVRDDI